MKRTQGTGKADKTKTSRTSASSRRKHTAFFLLAVILFSLVCILFFLPSGREEGRDSRDRPAAGRTTDEGQPSHEPSAGREPSGAEPEREGGGAAASRRGELPPEKRPQPGKPTPRLAIVLDDAGYNLEQLDAYLAFPGQLTIAVLPHLPYSVEAAKRAREAGKEVILHCPMEPLGDADPGPGAITVGLSRLEIRLRLERAFRSVPGAIGMNNHMGSRLMSDPEAVSAVLEYLAEKGKFFLDSKTTARSVAGELAGRYGVAVLERSVFLDNVVSQEAIAEQLERGIRIAEATGSAVVVGHVTNLEVLSVLNSHAPALAERGVELTTLSAEIEELAAAGTSGSVSGGESVGAVGSSGSMGLAGARREAGGPELTEEQEHAE